MKPIDVKCGGCGEEFEAEPELAGQVLECPECGADIKIPSPAGAAEDDSGEEEVLEEKKPPKRHGAAASKPGGRGPAGKKIAAKASSRKTSQKSGKKGGNAKIIAGICGAAALLIAIVAAVALSGGGPDGKSGGSKGGGKSSSGGNGGGSGQSKPTKEERVRYEKALAEAQGAEDPALWVEAGDAAETAGLMTEAREAWKKALEIKEEFKPAMKKLGYQRFTLSSEAGEYELAGGEPFADLDQYVEKWVPPEEYERLRKLESGIIAKLKEDLQKRADNPFYDAAKQVEQVLAKRPGLSQRAWEIKHEKPYLVFEDKGPKGGKQNPDIITEKRLLAKVRMLKTMYKFLMDRFFTPVGLKVDEKNPLVVISLQDRKAFDDLHKEMDMAIPPYALAYYHRIHKYIILYNGAFEDGGGSFLENKAASDGVVWHEGTHQVVHAVLNPGHSSDSVELPYWMNEGIAEYVGSLDLEDDPDEEGNDVYKPCCLNKMRLREFYFALHPERLQMAKQAGIKQPYAVDVERLLECHSHATTNAAVAKMYKDPSEGEKAGALFGTGLPYYQGTFFFYFCFNYENGKYADMFNKYLASSFKGFYYPENFKDAFRGVDLGQLTKEWFDYVNGLCKDNLR